MPKAQYQKRMNRGGRSTGGGGGSTSVSGGGTIPETVSAQTGNTIDTAGRHTHAVLASSNPGNHEVLLKTDADGQLHLLGAELDQLNPTSVLFQEDGIAIIGGSLAIVPDSGYLAATVDSAATTIDFGRQMTPGHFVIIRGVTASRNRAVEFLQVGALVSGTTYNVTRDVTNLNATDPAWPVGMPYAVLGAQGAGRLWLTSRPARYWLSIQGETADAYTNVVGIGDLNGGWGYNSQTYGMALGEYGAGKANLTWDPVNGLRIRRHTETLIHLDNDGHATIAGWEIDPGHLAKNGVILNSAGYLLLGLGSDIIRLDAQHSHWRMWAGAVTGDDAPFGVTKAGAIKATAGTIGGWSLSQNSIVGAGMVLGAGTGYLHAGDIEGGDVLVIDSSDDTHRLWAGATLKLDAPFAILKDGSIKASAGTIGGWNISATGLYSGEGTDRVVLTVANPTYRFWAGAASAAEAPFAILKDGSIKASSGTIGGWTLSATGLYSGEGTNRVVLTVSNPTYRFWAGAVSAAEASFRLSATGALDTAQYIAGLRGWRISEIGDAEFNNVSIRGELHAAVMAYGEQHVNAGTLVIAKSAGKLREDVTTLASPATFFVRIEDPDVGAIQLFAVNDRLRIKDGSGNDNWLLVTSVTRSTNHWRYTCRLLNGTPATFSAGAAVTDYGQSGDGYLVMTADLAGAPYYDVQTHSGSPWADAVVRVRLGNLNGVVDAALNPAGYGLYASNVYLRGDIVSAGGNILINEDGIEIKASNLQTDLNSYKFRYGEDVFGGLYGRTETNPPYLFNTTDVLLTARSPEGMDAAIYISSYAPVGQKAQLDLTCTALGAATPPGIFMFNSPFDSYLDVRIAGRNNRFSATGVILPGDTDPYLLFVSADLEGRVGIGTNMPVTKLDVAGAVGQYGNSGGRKAYRNVASLTSYTDNAVKRVFSLKIAAGQMWCGEITLSTHRAAAGNYGSLSRYWLWVYRDADGVVRQNVIRKLDDYTVAGQVDNESLTGVWDGDTLHYTFQRDHVATPVTCLTVMVDGFAYGATEMAVSIVDAPYDPPDPPDPPPDPPAVPLTAGHYRMLGVTDPGLATALFYWDELEPQAGVYNWSIVDNWLATHPGGMIQVFFHISGMSGTNTNFFLRLPSGVPSHAITVGDQIGLYPAYDNTTFVNRYVALINAMGARYDGHPVIANLGLDGESQYAKTQSGVDWRTAVYGTAANAVPYRFRTTYLTAVLEAYRAAFPNSVVMVNCAPGGTDTRMAIYQYVMTHTPRLALKSSGLVNDTDSWYGYDASGNPPTHANVLDGTYSGLLGLWDIIRLGRDQGLITVTESAYGFSADALMALYAGLHYHPAAMTWHKEWLETPGLLTQAERDWALGYLGKTKATTPGVWWARHNTAFPKYKVGSSGYYSGHGNCEFWLVQEDATTWTVATGVTLTSPTVLVRYTGTGTMTINGTPYTLPVGGEQTVQASGAVTTVTVTGATVTFIELRK